MKQQKLSKPKNSTLPSVLGFSSHLGGWWPLGESRSAGKNVGNNNLFWLLALCNLQIHVKAKIIFHVTLVKEPAVVWALDYIFSPTN